MRLRSRQRLRRQSDFAAVRQEGRRQFGAAFVFAARKRPPLSRVGADLPRFAVVASRRVGNAVVRNRLKRRMREIFRTHQQIFPAELDIVVTLQTKAVGMTFAELEKQFLGAAKRLGYARTFPQNASGETPDTTRETRVLPGPTEPDRSEDPPPGASR
jgi:ribonuclease P protein component